MDMAEEIDDNGFYREDFSAESDWEILNAQLYELFQKWQLSKVDWGRPCEPNELFYCNWKIEEELLNVKDNQLAIVYYKADLTSPDKDKTNKTSVTKMNMAPMHEDLMSLSNSFGPPVLENSGKNIHSLAKFYGLRRFVVLNSSSADNNYNLKRSEFRFFLSAISVVAAEVDATVPVFIQIYDQKGIFFLGLGLTTFMRTNFDFVALEQPPEDYRYMSGLLAMFNEKVPKYYKQPALVSVRTTYSWNKVSIRVPMYVPLGMTPLIDEERSIISLSRFTALPHGFFPDSRTEMTAIFTWPELAGNMIIDSPIQTQFLPVRAPFSAIHLSVNATSYLTMCIKYFHNLIPAKNSLESYVGRNFLGNISFSEAPIQLSHFRKNKTICDGEHLASLFKKPPGPMKEHELKEMLCHLFPDLHKKEALFCYESHVWWKDFHRIKSAVPDSLVHRLSCLLATCNAHFGGKSGMAQLWVTFTRELRLLWECGIPVQGVAEGFPDTTTCLLHQKLQMLNICISRRLQRDLNIKAKPQWSELKESHNDEDEGNDTEEEFFDCNEDEEHSSSSPVKEDVETTKPEGRLKRLRDLKLLDSEEYLYVPITQEPVPKTEDQLQDDADVMLRYGSDVVTAMMSSTLQSDAEAFKAANLNARFEDFIRWYSPNDWEEYLDDENIKQHKLSPRMSAKGNTWQMLWEQALPVSASKQKRLFDDTAEGYKVLRYLETRNIGEIYGLTIVPLLHSAILKLKNILSNSNVLELFSEFLDEILADLSRFSRDIEIVPGLPTSTSSTSTASTGETNYILQLPSPLAITKKIEELEMQFYQYKCFESLPELAGISSQQIQNKFREMLKNQGSCSVSLGNLRETETENTSAEIDERLMASFEQIGEDKLIMKDYVMRLGEGLIEWPVDERDNENVMPPMPQFLRAIVTGQSLRLCGAFTEHTTFLT